ncbi:MAG: hypothetical protein Q4G35_05445 [Propionibacteriaceae bacterium]|nr:hypothetical protein [Propionibacteriaceae bacterium]
MMFNTEPLRTEPPAGVAADQLELFAEANGLTYERSTGQIPYKGMIFRSGEGRTITHRLRSEAGPFADAGGFRAIPGGADSDLANRWNYAAFRLPRPMPHIVLDARANNPLGISNLPTELVSSQRLKMGDPFDKRFTLYAPEGYEQDLFYLFPAHVQEALLAAPAKYDIEIKGSWLFLYTKGRQDLRDPATWEFLGHIAEELMGRMTPIAERWRDRKAIAPTTSKWRPRHPAVGAGGQQLQHRFPWRSTLVSLGVVIILAVLYVASGP